MKVIEYDQICSGDFKIVIRTSNARHVIPTVNTIPRPSSGVVDEDQTSDKDGIKDENDVPEGMPSDSGVARSVAEPKVESDPYPVSEDGEVGSVRGWNRLFFGKEDPREIEKKGFRLEIMVHEDTVRYFCGPRVLRPAVGSVLEASDYGWDAVALGIVVSAIHGQYEHVPVEIDLQLFVKIAVIADYMECGDALSMASRVWLSNIDDPKAGKGWESAALMWFYVSWVFPLDDLFVSMTGLVVMGYQGPETLELNGLPLQGFIGKLTPSHLHLSVPLTTRLEKLDKLRQGNIDRLLNKMNELGSLLLVEEGCPHANDVQCSMMTLGYLRRLKHKFRHLEPPVVFPYPGYTIQDVCSMIETFPEQGIDDEAHGHDHEQAEHPCTVRGRMLKDIQSLKEDIDDVFWDYAELWGYPGRIWDADSE
ncbi:hypothetical protein FMUND_4285 [Fusarium mundagurra]|uniref:Uncharacterized protein n=1 Tax=Fusarium mundagurra TaxID=1567541 RepID=A0A8H6DJZ3_9HYPO|nr:hypothetical protein FMUND_4285 [Fusarium mundagurra]